MAANSEERYVFKVEWYDQGAAIIRHYLLTFYPADKSLDMYDIKNKRMFLKRSKVVGVAFEQFYIGAIVTVFSRKLKIAEYGDVFTRKRFETDRQRTFAIIKPDVYTQMGKIIDAIKKNGLTINRLKMGKMTLAQAQEFYREHEGKPFYEGLVNFMSSDVCVGMELIGNDAIAKWRGIIGPTNPITAKAEAPQSLRGQFGTENPKNAVHGSDSPASAHREIELYFSMMRTCAVMNNCAMLIIKPHIIESGMEGRIIDRILEEGFEISGMNMVQLDKATAEEFFEVYKGVLPEYAPMVEHATSGPVLALEIRQENVVPALRELVGPHDPQIAKQLRPNTLRAQFGIDKTINAVHATDLPEDGVLECEYFFNILEKS